MTQILRINRDNYQEDELLPAVKVLKMGGLVAFPTETVYGLGANALDATAATKIYAAKGRPSDNPLIVHINSPEDIKDLAEEIPDAAWQLAKHFWPGPLTMVLKKQDKIPSETCGGLETVGIRCPEDKIARDLIRISGVYIAAPSANLSGKPSPTMAEHVIHDMDGRIDMIIDGGGATLGLESTIIDLTCNPPMLLRPGFITLSMLQNVIGDVKVDPVVTTRKPDPSLKPKAPGMKYRHYAPEGNLTIVEGEEDKVIQKINNLMQTEVSLGKQVGVITTSEHQNAYKVGKVFVIGDREHEESIASHLFAILRELDVEHIDVIYAESFLDMELGQAIMNRLLKAAGYHVIQAEE